MKPFKKLLHTSACCLFAIFACACDTGEDQGTGAVGDNSNNGGKADSLDSGVKVVEAGRFFYQGEVLAELKDGAVPAYRIASFGNTHVRISLSASEGELTPVLVIDGPMPDATGTIVTKSEGEASSAAIDFTLEKPGFYRILAGTKAAFAGEATSNGKMTLKFECLAKCDPAQISLRDLLSAMSQQNGEAATADFIKTTIPQMFASSPEMAAAVAAQALVAYPALMSGQVEAYPVIPADKMAEAIGILEGQAPEAPAAAPAAVEVSLDALRGACKPAWPGFEPVEGTIPGLTRGAIAERRFDDCSMASAQKLAELLNGMSLGNGSALVVSGQRYSTVESAIGALIDSGYQIEVENDRFYANFSGLYFNGASVVLPVWIDTGLDIGGGKTLKIPASHAHWHIYIKGQGLDVELKYFMGIDIGTAFRAHDAVREAWNGKRVFQHFDTKTSREKVTEMFQIASELRNKWFQEGKSLPALGYGRLGVCMDSTAVLEYALGKTISLYPLAHPPVAAPSDELDQILAALPSDLAGQGKETALQRVLSSQPFDSIAAMDLTVFPFPLYKADLDQVW